MRNPFRYFNSSPEVIRLVVMMYIRYGFVTLIGFIPTAFVFNRCWPNLGFRLTLFYLVGR